MNPLDKEELKAFLKVVKNDMPIHTDKTARVPSSQYSQFPKNLMEYSEKIDNKFLNDNLHIIEEMEYRKKGITNDFKDYQNKYYDESGILNHDLYFKHDGKIYAKVSGGSFFNQNTLSFSNASLNRALASGATIEAGDTSTSGAANYGLFFMACKCPNTGVIGQSYNRVAANMITTSITMHLAVYSDSSNPDVRLADCTDFSSTATYDWQSVTEFALTSTQNWIAIQVNTLNWNIYYQAVATTCYYPAGSPVYANPMRTPFSPTVTNYNLGFNSKMGHT